MKQKYYSILGFIAIIAVIVISGCIQQQLPTGIIRTCEYTMGEETCGKCYCLETPERGCEIIDISEIGDLAYAVNKTVRYEGTRDIISTKMCPHYIKLFKIIFDVQGYELESGRDLKDKDTHKITIGYWTAYNAFKVGDTYKEVKIGDKVEIMDQGSKVVGIMNTMYTSVMERTRDTLI